MVLLFIIIKDFFELLDQTFIFEYKDFIGYMGPL